MSAGAAESDRSDVLHGPGRLKRALKIISALSKSTGICLPRQAAVEPRHVATMAVCTMPMIEVEFDGFTMPDTICAASGGISSFYVRWLEAAGIRVCILQWDDPWDEKLRVLECVNGVLFPGGDLDHFQSTIEVYLANVKQIYKYAVDRAAVGDPFVVFGTCQGCQLICAAAADDLSIVEPGFVGVECKMLNLELTPEAACPRRLLFRSDETPPHILRYLQASNSTLNVHRWGVAPGTFAKNAKLAEAFTVLSTNVDAAGRRFVSTLEHKHAAIFALQWHAEWPPFDFSDARIEQTQESLAVSSYMAHFIREQLRKNTHHFQTLRSLEGSVVERSPTSHEGFGWELYWARPRKRSDATVADDHAPHH